MLSDLKARSWRESLAVGGSSCMYIPAGQMLSVSGTGRGRVMWIVDTLSSYSKLCSHPDSAILFKTAIINASGWLAALPLPVLSLRDENIASAFEIEYLAVFCDLFID